MYSEELNRNSNQCSSARKKCIFKCCAGNKTNEQFPPPPPLQAIAGTINSDYEVTKEGDIELRNVGDELAEARIPLLSGTMSRYQKR